MSNDAGTKTKKFDLTVIGTPTWQTSLANIPELNAAELNEGQIISLSVAAAGADSYVWYVNGVEVGRGPTYELTVGADLTSVEVRATNIAGTKSSSIFNIKVLPKPISVTVGCLGGVDCSATKINCEIANGVGFRYKEGGSFGDCIIDTCSPIGTQAYKPSFDKRACVLDFTSVSAPSGLISEENVTLSNIDFQNFVSLPNNKGFATFIKENGRRDYDFTQTSRAGITSTTYHVKSGIVQGKALSSITNLFQKNEGQRTVVPRFNLGNPDFKELKYMPSSGTADSKSDGYILGLAKMQKGQFVAPFDPVADEGCKLVKKDVLISDGSELNVTSSNAGTFGMKFRLAKKYTCDNTPGKYLYVDDAKYVYDAYDYQTCVAKEICQLKEMIKIDGVNKFKTVDGKCAASSSVGDDGVEVSCSDKHKKIVLRKNDSIGLVDKLLHASSHSFTGLEQRTDNFKNCLKTKSDPTLSYCPNDELILTLSTKAMSDLKSIMEMDQAKKVEPKKIDGLNVHFNTFIDFSARAGRKCTRPAIISTYVDQMVANGTFATVGNVSTDSFFDASSWECLEDYFATKKAPDGLLKWSYNDGKTFKDGSTEFVVKQLMFRRKLLPSIVGRGFTLGVIKFREDGSVDTDFGVDGFGSAMSVLEGNTGPGVPAVPGSLGFSKESRKTVVQKDHSILIGINVFEEVPGMWYPLQSVPALVRLNPSGEKDYTLHPGKEYFKIPHTPSTNKYSQGSYLLDFTTDKSENILTLMKVGDTDLSLHKFKADGTEDTSFATNGEYLLRIAGYYLSGTFLNLREGKIYLTREGNIKIICIGSKYDSDQEVVYYMMITLDKSGKLIPASATHSFVSSVIIPKASNLAGNIISHQDPISLTVGPNGYVYYSANYHESPTPKVINVVGDTVKINMNDGLVDKNFGNQGHLKSKPKDLFHKLDFSDGYLKITYIRNYKDIIVKKYYP